MSRRRSISTPLPRSVGPVAPSAIASLRDQVCNALGAYQPDGIAGEQVLVLIDCAQGSVGEFFHSREETQRRLQRQAADAEVRGHHPLAGDHFEHAQHVFALAEAIEEDGHRADVHARACPARPGAN